MCWKYWMRIVELCEFGDSSVRCQWLPGVRVLVCLYVVCYPIGWIGWLGRQSDAWSARLVALQQTLVSSLSLSLSDSQPVHQLDVTREQAFAVNGSEGSSARCSERPELTVNTNEYYVKRKVFLQSSHVSAQVMPRKKQDRPKHVTKCKCDQHFVAYSLLCV